MDNSSINIPGGEEPANGLSAIQEEAVSNIGLPTWYCGRSILLLAALAIACVLLVLSPVTVNDVLPLIMAFPFAQIGRGLRALSLPGGAGNVIAIVLYVAFCLLPMLALLFIRKKSVVDVLLPLISIVMFVVMYYMINPGITRASTITGVVDGVTRSAIGAGAFEQALLGGIVYSLLMAYGILRVIGLFNSASARGLGRYMGIMLHLLNAMFVILVFGIVFSQLLDAFAVLGAGNTAPGQRLGATYVFLVLHHIVRALPYVLNIWVVTAAQRMLTALNADPYSNETLAAAKDVSRICVIALAVSALSLAGFNLLQLMFASLLYVINSNINFPITSMMFVLGALLLTRYIAENKLLKDENDQFV